MDRFLWVSRRQAGTVKQALHLSESLPEQLHNLIAAGQQRRRQGYRGRFAPTPSGPLHLGNLRTALLSWLDARICNGVWLLRIDDLDTPRLQSGAIDACLADLRWLGLSWDGPVILQSQHRGWYHSLLSHWRRCDRLYACRCSRRELNQHSLYPGHCRDCEMGWGWKNRRLPAWRLRVPKRFAHRCGDLVVRRSDGFIAYHLATALDEMILGITDVVRGSDLAPVKIAQEAVIAAMGLESPPRYRHVPLLCDREGLKLSKRNGSQGLPPWQDRPASAAATVGRLAASLDLVPPGSQISTPELLEHVRVRPTLLKSHLQP